ncbi:protein SSUH2 homolog [Argiope bruennichi]|uniref:protein SSUH2 homolog n=1 Tax=Argiope bruennichi TaxID=94029 RepID=UPI0024945420|nr:protein SSUH2 homolog [Argiope bruennichi]XP_055938002.1 protein SSUH2 homolog [Argiope bruennichi]
MENPGYTEYMQGTEKQPATLTTLEQPSSVPTSPLTAPLTDGELREACQTYVKDFCCYGSKFLREMNLIEIQNVCAFHYKLESLGERRETVVRSVAYQGEYVDTSGVAPDPWEVRVATDDGTIEFKEHQVVTIIPNTAYLSDCIKCTGRTKLQCGNCYGRGVNNCCNCNGTGRVAADDDCFSTRTTICIWCIGTGTKTCCTCHGRGEVRCKACKQGKMKNHQELIITWKPHVDDFISNTQNLPKELILGVEGRELFSERANPVQPINLPYDRCVNEASSYFVSKHGTSFTEEQIIAQRHNLRAVPYTKATYTWKNKKGEFYVYGLEKKVYFEDYPQTCCLCTCC